jgi:DNA-binding XRE family transcriptional regulator
MSMRERFWAKVGPPNEDGCRLWTAGLNTGGYGSFGIRSYKSDAAHRVAWLLTHGSLPPKGLFVCHTCDVRRCCEPSHLWLGTHLDNQADKRAKGRNVMPPSVGEHNTQARLTEDQVVMIRQAYASGAVDQITLAQQYGVHRATIAMITTGRTWKHVSGPLTRGEALRWSHRS